MSGIEREYRIRIAEQGKDAVDGHVEAVLGLDTLAGVPVITGQIVHLTQGSTETMPFTVLALDRDGFLTRLFTANRRWVALGRLLDVQYRDLPSGPWVTYGTGRISALDEADGPGRYRVEVSDESWKARSSRIFTTGDTTQIWPHGIKAHWRGWAGALPADGAREAQRGKLYRIRLRAGRGNRGRYISPALIDWADSDAVAYDERLFGSDAVEGNFRNLRLNYAGKNYPIVSFGPVEAHGDILETLKSPEDKNPRSEYREVTIRAWVYADSLPPPSGAAFLHAPEAEPSEDLPLHVGLADPGHDWGTESGWFHPATLTHIYWDLTGQLYDSAALAALEADTSFPALAFRITNTPKDPDRWFQDHVWGPCMLVALRNGQGRRKLVDMRLPQNLDPDTLPVIHAGNSNARTWRLVGREAANQIIWSYLNTIQHGMGAAVGEGLGGSAGLDGIVAEEREDSAREGDTVDKIGARPLSLSLIGAHEPTAHWPSRDLPGLMNTARGTAYQGAVAVMTRDLLDIYQDGPVLGSIELGRELAETLEEGSLAILDESSLEGPNPETGARSGDRLVRIIALTRHPAHAEAEYLDLGPSAQPLPPPQVGVTPDPADFERVRVTLSGVPEDALATVEVAFTDTAGEPASWPVQRAGLKDGTLSIGGVPGSGYAHVRAKTTASGRIRSRWVSVSVALPTSPRVRAVEAIIGDDGVPVISWIPNAHAAGVRVRFAVHAPDDPDPGLSHQVDVNASTGEVEPPAAIRPDELITVEVTPWSGWTGSAVSGVAGPSVQLTVAHPNVPSSERPIAAIELGIETATHETLRFSGQLGDHGRLPLSYQFAVEGVSAWSPWASMPSTGVIITDGAGGRPAPLARGERTRTVLLRVRDALGRESQVASYALSHEPTGIIAEPRIVLTLIERRAQEEDWLITATTWRGAAAGLEYRYVTQRPGDPHPGWPLWAPLPAGGVAATVRRLEDVLHLLGVQAREASNHDRIANEWAEVWPADLASGRRIREEVEERGLHEDGYDGLIGRGSGGIGAGDAIDGIERARTGLTVGGIVALNKVVASSIAPTAVEADKIAAGAVTAGKIAAGTVSANEIAAGAITAQKIAAKAVVAGKIDAGAVTATELAANAVTAGKIAANAVTAATIAAGAVIAGKIAANAVDTNALAAGAVSAGKIAADAVGAAQLAAGAVTTDKIQAGAVSAAKIATTDLSAISANLGKVTAGSLESPDGKLKVDADNQLITIQDKQAPPRERVRIGKLGGATTDYGLEVRDASNKLILSATGLGAEVVGVQQFGAGLRPVESLAALPAAGTPGRVVYNQADGRLYRDTGSGWTAATPAEYGTQNLLGVNAAKEITIVGGGTSGTSSNLMASTPLDALGLKVGGHATLSCDAKSEPGGRANLGIRWLDSANAVIRYDTSGPRDTQGAWARLVTRSSISIPEGCVAVSLYYQGYDAGTKWFKLAMFNAGPVDMPYEEPPFRVSRETIDQLEGQLKTAQIAVGAITESVIAANAITATKIAVDAVTAPKIANNAITAGKIAANAVTEATIAADAITAPKIANNAVTAGKIAAKAVAEAQIAVGAITESVIAANAVTATKIADNAISTPKIAAGAVAAGKIAAGAVTANEIATNAVTAGKIAAGAVIAEKIATNAVTADKITAKAVTAGKIDTGAVTATEIAANAVIAGKVAANAVTAGTIAAGAVTAGKIAANAVTAAELAAGAVTAEKIAANAVEAGNIAADAVTANEIAAGAVIAEKIATNAVTAGKIEAGAVTAGKIAAGAVTASEIAANAVTAQKIGAKAVTAGKIDANAVTATELAANAVTAGKIAANAVTAGTIAANAVTAGKIAANAVAADQIAAGAVTAAKIAVSDLSAIKANLGDVTAGVLRSSDDKLRVDANSKLITIKDQQASPVERVKIGKVGAGANDWGIQVRNALGALILDATGLGSGVVGPAQMNDTTAAIEIVNSLPIVGGKVGRTVYLSTDGRLYRWTGASWIAGAPAEAGTQNLCGPDAGTERSALYGAVKAEQISLADVGVTAGERVSFGVEVRCPGNAANRGRIRIEFYDDNGTSKGGAVVYYITGALWRRYVDEDLAIPAGTTWIFYEVWNFDGVAPVEARYMQVNRGPNVLPFEATAWRPGSSKRLPPGAVVTAGGQIWQNIAHGVWLGSAMDGQDVDFPMPYAKPPLVAFLTGGLSYHPSLSGYGHGQHFAAIALTTTGFTMYAKLRASTGVIGSPEVYFSHTGGAPPWRVSKISPGGSAAEAHDKRYTYTFSLFLPSAIIGGDPQESVAAITFWWYNGGAYIAAGTATYRNASGTPHYYDDQSRTWSINGLGSGAAFGMSVEFSGPMAGSADFSGISVKWTTVGAPKEESATHAGVSPIQFLVIGGYE